MGKRPETKEEREALHIHAIEHADKTVECLMEQFDLEESEALGQALAPLMQRCVECAPETGADFLRRLVAELEQTLRLPFEELKAAYDEQEDEQGPVPDLSQAFHEEFALKAPLIDAPTEGRPA